MLPDESSAGSEVELLILMLGPLVLSVASKEPHLGTRCLLVHGNVETHGWVLFHSNRIVIGTVEPLLFVGLICLDQSHQSASSDRNPRFEQRSYLVVEPR